MCTTHITLHECACICTGMWEPMQRQGEHTQAKGGPQGARWEVPNRPSALLQDLPQVQS